MRGFIFGEKHSMAQANRAREWAFYAHLKKTGRTSEST